MTSVIIRPFSNVETVARHGRGFAPETESRYGVRMRNRSLSDVTETSVGFGAAVKFDFGVVNFCVKCFSLLFAVMTEEIIEFSSDEDKVRIFLLMTKYLIFLFES